jgi:hypothetical protein
MYLSPFGWAVSVPIFRSFFGSWTEPSCLKTLTLRPFAQLSASELLT